MTKSLGLTNEFCSSTYLCSLKTLLAVASSKTSDMKTKTSVINIGTTKMNPCTCLGSYVPLFYY